MPMETTMLPPEESSSRLPLATAGKTLRVLVVEDSENDAILLLRTLRKAGYEPIHKQVCSAAAMRAALLQDQWDIVISDYEMPGFGGFEALEILKESGNDLPFILVSAVVSEETAVAAMKAGAHDYMMKRKLARLGPAIERELRDAQGRAARKAAEEALRESEEQLRHSQKMDAVGRLAASVAHDFNNILAAIMGHTNLLMQRVKEGDPLRKNIEPIEKCAYLAAALTKQLLAFSRKEPPIRQVLPLNDAVTNIDVMLRRLISGNIELVSAPDPEAGCIYADPTQIEQIVMNMVVNARDAMPGGGTIAVKTSRVARPKPGENGADRGLCEYALLSISDTGTGMTDEVKAHIFEPFYTTKPRGRGTGLGLATCFGIVKESNGFIEVRSELGKGTTFNIFFPRVTAPIASGGCLPHPTK